MTRPLSGSSARAEAWCLYPRADIPRHALAPLVRETIDLPPVGPHDVLCRPLYGSWEANMHHALTGDPVDICAMRGEAPCIVGNAGVVRVLEVGREVGDLEPGQAAIQFSAGVVDRFGYMVRASAYDAPGTMGCLATRMVTPARCLVPVPADTRFSLPQWAAFSIRHATAWANWRVAYGVLRLQVGEDELPVPHVWGWGGGTTLAELDLARRQGCATVMLSSRPERLAHIERLGVGALDRSPFRAVSEGDAEGSEVATQAFLDAVASRTGGHGVNIFLDYIGTPTLRATLKALAREGVVATAGWKGGMATSYRRAVECIQRHQHVHTHYARRQEFVDAVAYGELHGWMPEVDAPIPSFDQVPELARAYAAGVCGFFPVFAVDPD